VGSVIDMKEKKNGRRKDKDSLTEEEKEEL